MLLKNLSYRLKRFFQGESGVVEKVEKLEPSYYRNKINDVKDYYGNLPQKLIIRNPLGKLVTILSPTTTETLPDNVGLFDAQVYKKYKPGDTFP